MVDAVQMPTVRIPMEASSVLVNRDILEMVSRALVWYSYDFTMSDHTGPNISANT